MPCAIWACIPYVLERLSTDIKPKVKGTALIRNWLNGSYKAKAKQKQNEEWFVPAEDIPIYENLKKSPFATALREYLDDGRKHTTPSGIARSAPEACKLKAAHRPSKAPPSFGITKDEPEYAIPAQWLLDGTTLRPTAGANDQLAYQYFGQNHRSPEKERRNRSAMAQKEIPSTKSERDDTKSHLSKKHPLPKQGTPADSSESSRRPTPKPRHEHKRQRSIPPAPRQQVLPSVEYGTVPAHHQSAIPHAPPGSLWNPFTDVYEPAPYPPDSRSHPSPSHRPPYRGHHPPPPPQPAYGGYHPPPAQQPAYGGHHPPPPQRPSYGGYHSPPPQQSSYGGHHPPPPPQQRSYGGNYPPQQNQPLYRGAYQFSPTTPSQSEDYFSRGYYPPPGRGRTRESASSSRPRSYRERNDGDADEQNF